VADEGGVEALVLYYICAVLLAVVGLGVLLYWWQSRQPPSEFELQLQILGERVEALKREVGAALLPVLTEMVDAMAEFLERFKDE
jgi:hypothetical protein